jgi:hypothetical protein
MWDNENVAEDTQLETTDENHDFGDDFDDFAEEGGDDDFGDFDEADETTNVQPVAEAPPLPQTVPSVLDTLVSMIPHAGVCNHIILNFHLSDRNIASFESRL